MRKITKEQIINWLEVKGIRERFEKNYKAYMSSVNGRSEDQYSLDKYLDSFMGQVGRGGTTLEKLIAGCFFWIASPEGQNYWWKIETEFKEWLSEGTSPVKDSSPQKIPLK